MPKMKFAKSYITSAVTVFLALSMQPSFASSDDAWDDFRHDVEQACNKAAGDMMKIEEIKVDPYGSESYGYAIINGFEEGNKDPQQVVCVFDKKAKTVELSGFFDK
ncbi:hypothetical protein [Brucella gallinifaecis]|uniref:hypothetical protein n=1 Tax=Brucella gallinifaecis TaxID=215590 RepID=UPI0023618715|nr:hypothetical protein [Brucella gallinifaecis]